jgi:hypothetical protein
MQSGKSVSLSLKEATDNKIDPFSRAVRVWRVRVESGQDFEQIVSSLPVLSQTAPRRTFLWIIAKGLQGSPIDEHLGRLEDEMFGVMERTYEKHLQILPLKMVFPLMFLILPGVLLILVGPLLFNISESF